MAFEEGVDIIDMNLMQLPWLDKGSRLILNQPDRCSALALAKSDEIRTRIALLVKKLGYEVAHICYPGMKRGLEVFASMADDQNEEAQQPATPMPNFENFLKEADEMRVLDFMREQISNGLIVIITSQINDQCLYTSKSLKPERAFWTPDQFQGHNYAKSWDIDGVGHPSSEYDQMRSLLERDGAIQGYQYRLVRPDGALCEYQTDYYDVADGWGGHWVRIGVSRPEDYRVLQPAG